MLGVVFLVIAETLPVAGLTNERCLPPASRMGTALWQLAVTSAFWSSVGNALLTAAGLAVAVSAAVALVLVIGLVPAVRTAASRIEFLRVVWPTTLPDAVTGLRLGANAALLAGRTN